MFFLTENNKVDVQNHHFLTLNTKTHKHSTLIMPTPLIKPHHLLSESFEGQCDQTEAAANGQESKDKKRREQARMRAVRYRARKKEKTAQVKEKEELRKRIAQEKKRTRSARYYAKKKAAETMNNSHSVNNTDSTDNKNYSNMVKHDITTFFARPHSPSSAAAAAAAGNSNYHADSLSTPMQSGKDRKYFYFYVLYFIYLDKIFMVIYATCGVC
mmetsp:Transcript_10514/g.19632  ORF Transcript_10514/g.19632 Transcript_10514/m.19632 type:complete len:214 (-) Transcript_10514:1285-1926(-)